MQLNVDLNSEKKIFHLYQVAFREFQLLLLYIFFDKRIVTSGKWDQR